MKCLSHFFLSLTLSATVFSSISWAQTKYYQDPIAVQASNAAKQEKFAEAAALFESLEPKYPIQTQDDVDLLLTASHYAALAGDKEHAFALCERAINVPAKEGARPPGMIPGPVDLRGETRWQMAQIRRSQGRWNEALELYQLNRKTYPRNDGCVPSGYAFQEMAMVEGECLEHLGRFDDAVALYFPAALYLSSDVKPEAMRRLVEIYQANNQLQDLERNISRERAIFEEKLERDWIESDRRFDYREETKSRSAFATFDSIRHFQNVARLHKWNDLISALHGVDLSNPADMERSPSQRNRREAVRSLLNLDKRSRKEALRALQDHVKRNPTREGEMPNINIRAVILILQEAKTEAVEDECTQLVERQRDQLLALTTTENKELAPRRQAFIPSNLQLPTVLSSGQQ